MPHASRLILWSVASAAGWVQPGAMGASPLSAGQTDRVEIAMVGFTRESAEAFRTTTAAQAPNAPAAKPGKLPEATAVRRGETGRRNRSAVKREPSPAPVVVRRGPNRWPRILRNKWVGPLERIHVWWNRHFDRRHFPYPDNPPKAA